MMVPPRWLETVDDLICEISDTVREISEQAQLEPVGGESNKAQRMRFQVAALGLDAMLHEGMTDKALELCKLSAKDGKELLSHSMVLIESRVSRRRCWHVKSRGSMVYICIENYCSCPSFAMSLEADITICKHLVAVMLAGRLGTMPVKTVEEEEFSKYIFGSGF